MKNKVFVGASIDGYIADRTGGLDFLQAVPNPEQDQMEFPEFMDTIDALLMGRSTYETVLGFGVEWPYTKPVFVLSTTLTSVPDHLSDRVQIINQPIEKAVQQLNQQGYEDLYIDGGKLIQSFLQRDMIDEVIVSTIPILLGGGTSLFGELSDHLMFKHVNTTVMLNAIVQTHYRRIRQ